MATGVGLEGGHEPFYDFPCSLCEEEGKHIEAVNYCEECFVYMCDSCIKNHNKFPLHRRHQLLDQSQFVKLAQSKLVSFPTKCCLKHPGELVNIYCGNHDVVCCSSCKVLEHSKCVKTKHLIDAAKGIRKSKEYQSIKQETRLLLNDVVKVFEYRKADISRIENERQHVMDAVADFRKKVDKYNDDMEQNTLDALHDKAEIIVSSCKKDTKDLAVMKSTAEDMLAQLESFTGDNECDLFVQIKSGKKLLSNAVQEVHAISKTILKDAINFRINPTIEPYLSSLEIFGTFTDTPMNASQLSPVAIDKHKRQSHASTSSSKTSPDNHDPLPKYKTQQYGKFDVKVKSDSNICRISDICQLPDGNILIADSKNRKLKRLDQSYQIVDTRRLNEKPHSICNVGSHEVAVTLFRAKRVQYISVKTKLTLTWFFRTGDFCRGMDYVDGRLYVCCGGEEGLSPGCIEVYNNAGQRLQSISGLASIPLHIKVTDDGQYLLVTRSASSSITMMDQTGNIINTFSNLSSKQLKGICTDGNGQAFICGIESNKVIKFNPKQQKIDVILEWNNGVEKPFGICYDRKQSRILVATCDSNHLLVHSLK